VILVRRETTPDDVLGMQVSAGLLTCRGGLVPCCGRGAGWGIPAVVGAADVHIDGDTVTIGDTVLHEGDTVTIDGSTGNDLRRSTRDERRRCSAELEQLLSWADAVAAGHVEVRVNADTGGDAGVGRRAGSPRDRPVPHRAHVPVGRPAADHAPLHPQRRCRERRRRSHRWKTRRPPTSSPAHGDGRPAGDGPAARSAAARIPPRPARPHGARGAWRPRRQRPVELAAVRRLHEVNPMLGTRGVRLGVMRSGIYEMQVRALCRAAATLFERGHSPVSS
jgi:pyruvate, orthophosphate dikinase